MKITPYLFGLLIAFALGGLAPTLPFVVLAQSGSTDYIHACVKDSNGSIRIEAPGVACANNESALDWARNAGAGPQAPFYCPQCLINEKGGDRLVGKDLTNAMLYEAALAGADLHGANFSRAVLERADLSNTNLASTVFSNAILTNANLTDAAASSAVFLESDLQEAWALNADFSGADFTGANLSSAMLQGASFDGAILTDFVWQHTVCPDNTNSDDNGGTCVGHLMP